MFFLYILGKDGCIGCENVKKELDKSNVKYEYLREGLVFNTLKKAVNPQYYPLAIVTTNNYVVREYFPELSNNVIENLINRFKG